MLTAQLLGPDRVPIRDERGRATTTGSLRLNIMHWLSALKTWTPAAWPRTGSRASNGGLSRPSPAPAAAPAPARGRKAIPARGTGPSALDGRDRRGVGGVDRADLGRGRLGDGVPRPPGLLMTNSHVIDDEFMANVKVRFPSAEKGQQGPFPAELVYEDSRRDLALLAVKSTLPPLRIAPSYTFRKGDDIVVIGNPGARPAS